MHRPLIIAILLLATLLATGCGKETSEDTKRPTVVEHGQAPRDETVTLEAEAFTGELEPPMEIEEVDGASGGKVVRIEDGKGKPGDEREDGGKCPERFGAATYTFDIKTSGTYKVWGRVWWKDSCGNSLTLVMNRNMARAVVLGEDGTHKHWHWVAASRTFKLDAGANTLEVLNREDGVRLDKLIVTSDPKLVPQDPE